MTENSQKKEVEVLKIKELSDNYKEVFENMNEEKEILVSKNQKMTKEMLEIRDIFKQILGESGDADEEDE